MPRTESPRTRRDREAARRAAQEAALIDAQRRAARRRGLIGIGVVIGVILAIVLVIKGATGEKERKDAKASSTSGPTTTAAPAPLVSLPVVAPGASVRGSAACPAADGSSPRTTTFDQAPPMCLDPQVDYEAQIRTSKGPLKVNLNEESSAAAVNAFVFLARYHYYDGLPVTVVRRGAYAQVADPEGGPGFRLPTAPDKNIALLGSLLVGLTPQSGTVGGGLTIGMPGDQFTSIAQDTATLGMILDARPDQRPGSPDDQRTVTQLINDAASASGGPTQVITIDGVDIIECRIPGEHCQRT